MRLSRLTVLAILGLSLLAATLAAEAQPAGKVYRLGLLSPVTPQPPGTYDAQRDLVEVLHELGYGEGPNLEVERRYADGRVERLPALAADLVKRRVDVVVAFSLVAGRAALA
jgi:putative tryptophan/tyrosine transport system substrate-binding protein